MILARAPLRVSFLGGGTDYPAYFNQSVGSVVGCAIDHYVYVAVNSLPLIAEQRIRFTYRTTESVERPEDLEHPVLRESLRLLGIDQPLNVATMADLPGGTGLGSSSAFTVALLSALREFFGMAAQTPEELAREAVFVERDLLGEHGGWQDQFHSAVGGLRRYMFDSGTVWHEMVRAPQGFQEVLSRSCILIPFGDSRQSSRHAHVTDSASLKSEGRSLLDELARVSQEACAAIEASRSAEEAVVELAHGVQRSWAVKRKLAVEDKTSKVDSRCQDLVSQGALAAKLCGAGGSGFILAVVEPNQVDKFNCDVLGGRGIRCSIATRGIELWRH